MSLVVWGNWALQGLWEYRGLVPSPGPPTVTDEACGQARLPLCSPPPQQEGTRRFQDRSLGCIWKPWRRGFKFGPIPVSGGSAIWILFAVPWQGNLSRTVERGQEGGGSLCGQGPGWLCPPVFLRPSHLLCLSLLWVFRTRTFVIGFRAHPGDLG